MQTGRLERLGTPMRRLYCPETCLDQSFSLSRLGTPMRRTPSANHLHGLRLLGKSESLPALPWWSANLPPPTKPLPPLASLGQTPYRYSAAMMAGGLGRPLTPAMQMEMARLRYKPPLYRSTAEAKAAEKAARLKAEKREKSRPGPKKFVISQISCEDLPDADKGMGGGTSDPFLTFELTTDLGHREQAKTKTIWNAPRDVSFPDVLEMPCPDQLLRGKCNATLIVRVWDDDSIEDGQENVGTNDLMGQNAYRFNCRLLPYKIEGFVDRQTFAGMAGMYAFRVSFRYDAVPLPPPPPKMEPGLTKLNAVGAEGWGWGEK